MLIDRVINTQETYCVETGIKRELEAFNPALCWAGLGSALTTVCIIPKVYASLSPPPPSLLAPSLPPQSLPHAVRPITINTSVVTLTIYKIAPSYSWVN